VSVSINHVAVFVRDLEAVRSFYETYFGAVANDQYHNPRTGLRTYFLTFEGGCRLELMTRPDVQASGSAVASTTATYSAGPEEPAGRRPSPPWLSEATCRAEDAAMVGNVVGSAFRRRGKRESGENPGLSRSGEWRRWLSQGTGEIWEAKAGGWCYTWNHKSEDLPAIRPYLGRRRRPRGLGQGCEWVIGPSHRLLVRDVA